MKTSIRFSVLYGVLCPLITLLIMGWNYSASAYDASDRAACYNNWKTQFYWQDAYGGNLRLQQGTGSPMSFWVYAEGIEVIEDAVMIGIENSSNINNVCTGFVNVNGTSWSGNSFNDDLFWASIAFSRAYQGTGNTQWKTLAKNAFDTAYGRGLDTDGGVFQATDRTNPKASVASETGCLAAYLIYQTYGDSTYKTKAQGLYNYLLAHAYQSGSGMVYGAKDTPPSGWGLATSDNGLFATASAWLGYPANANLTCDFITNNWSIAMHIQTAQNTDDGPQNGIGLRGMARAGRDISWGQAACQNAWNMRNTYGLVNCDWAAATPNTYNMYCSDCLSVVAGMLNLPVLKVTWGNYGPIDNYNLGWDEAATVDSHVNNTAGSLSLAVNNTTMGGDPAPGHVKQLKAIVSIGGSLELFYVAENSTLNVMAGSGTIVSATYGPVDGSSTPINVASRFTGGVRNITINNTTMGSDPAPGHAKQLVMVYSVGGKQETVVVAENAALNL